MIKIKQEIPLSPKIQSVPRQCSSEVYDILEEWHPSLLFDQPNSLIVKHNPRLKYS